MIVKFTGPTGMETITPKTHPVRAATNEAGRSKITVTGRGSHRERWLVVVLVLEFGAHPAGDVGADEAVDQVGGKEERQYPRQDLAPQDHQSPDEKHRQQRFRERLRGTQIQLLERRVFHLAD